MIVESLALNADGDCHCCQRQEVPCVELGCYEREQDAGAIVEIRIQLRVSVCVECLRGVMDAKALPVLPATCGECELFERSGVSMDGQCGISADWLTAIIAPPARCPLRKGAA